MSDQSEAKETVLRQMYRCIRRGFLDSIALHRCLIVTMKSKKIRMRLVQCVLLNGVIFLGSIMLYSYIVSPILVYFLRFFFRDAGSSLVETVASWMEWLYYLIWVIPVYLLSFVLNTIWYQDIANESMGIMAISVPSTGVSSLSGRIAEAIYRVIFNMVFLIFLTLIAKYRLIYLLSLSFFISLNAFEFRYKNLGDRISIIEGNWLYFLSFGFSLSLLVVQFPTLVENGLVSLFFPSLLITASTGSKPIGGPGGRIRLFKPIQVFTNIIVWLIARFKSV